MVPQSTAAALALCLIATLSTAAPAQVTSEERNGAVDVTATAMTEEPAAQTLHRFGILGSVAQPGVYLSLHGDLTLAELVEAAGGSTSPAVQSAQVIRRGHTGPRLNCSPPSTARLMPGDVVVLQDSAAAQPQQSPEMVGVALVGITPGEPVVVLLPPSLAAVDTLIAALNQKPELIDSVRVLRTSVEPLAAASLPAAALLTGDVVVFDPSAIDRAALARAEAFPPPVLIPPRRRDTAAEIVIQPQQNAPATRQTPPVAAVSAAERFLTNDRATKEDSHPKEVWPLMHTPFEGTGPATPTPLSSPETLPEMVSLPLTAAQDQPAADADAEAAGLDPATAENAGQFSDSGSPEQKLLATSLVGPQRFPVPEPAATRLAAEAPPGSTTDSADDRKQVALAGNLSERPAVAGTAASAATPVSYAQSNMRPSSAASAPSAPAEAEDSRGFGMRAMTVGTIVLATALLCFAASLLWSRLDDSTGLPRTATAHSQEQLPIHSLTAHRGTLDRLINNTLPIIEEPTPLPERADYHGQAVGRERLRIDTEQKLTGPHFAAPRQTPQPVAVPETAGTANTRPKREDSPAGAPSGEATASPAGESTQGGLLDRVLVAMERERRR